jgi:hypothetical protein
MKKKLTTVAMSLLLALSVVSCSDISPAYYGPPRVGVSTPYGVGTSRAEQMIAQRHRAEAQRAFSQDPWNPRLQQNLRNAYGYEEAIRYQMQQQVRSQNYLNNFTRGALGPLEPFLRP